MSEDRIARIRRQMRSNQVEVASSVATDVAADIMAINRELQATLNRASMSSGSFSKVNGNPIVPEFRNYFVWGKSTWGVDNTTSSPSGSPTLLDRGTLSAGDRGGVYRSVSPGG